MEKISFEEIIKKGKGAVVVDVRTKKEYEKEHIKGCLNIPLDEISNATEWLIKDVPIIVCCETGSRSSRAKDILDAKGFKHVYNGGRCMSLGEFRAGSCPVE